MKVRPHTNLKHRTIGYYFKICRDVMSKGRSLYYVDLYSGDGECKCSDAPREEWQPPYLKMLERARKRGIDLRCVFNDNDAKKIKKLQKSLESYKDLVLEIYSEDANEIYKKILNDIPSHEWSIFNLDPFKHRQLEFSTIEGIANHEGYDQRIGSKRKPELIISFMVFSILRNLQTINREDVSRGKKEKIKIGIDNFLGTREWRDKILESDSDEIKPSELFLDIFLDQLEDLGYKPVTFRIEQTIRENIIYYLIFATSIEKAYEIINERFEPYVKQVKKEKWIKQNFKFYKRAKAREKGIEPLTKWMPTNN